jgi:hypothetical protein
MEDHQVNVIVGKEEGSKSSNAINPMEDQVNVVKEESKSSNAINPRYVLNIPLIYHIHSDLYYFYLFCCFN